MTQTHSDLGAAIIGTGFIGEVHVDALRRLAIPIRGVLGSSDARSQDAAGRWRAQRVYRSVAEIVADPGVQVVHVTSPNDAHHDQVLELLDGGKHVVCEKPLALSSEQTAEMTRAATSSGLVHAVNFNVRYYPLVQEARQRVRQRDVGAVRLISGGYLQDWLAKDTDWSWRLDPRRGGELRTIGDIGSHWLDMAQYVLDSPIVEVCADLGRAFDVRQRPTGSIGTFGTSQDVAREPVSVEGEDLGVLLVRFANGARGAVTVSQVSPGRKNHLSFELAGTNESLAWNSERADEMWHGQRDQHNAIMQSNPALLSPQSAARTVTPGGFAEGFESTFLHLYRDVYRCITGEIGESSHPTFVDGHQNALLLDAVASSARERRWVPVERNIYR